MTESKNYQITLLSDVSMQSNLFKDSLERGLQLTVNMVSVDDLRTHDGSSRLLGDFVLFDFQYLDDDRFNEYSQIKAASETAIKEIVINCPKDVTSTQLFKWRNLVGVFYIEDDISLLIKGMEKIMNDEMWLSRKVAQDYIEYFRCANTVTTSQAYANLTKREKEIMRLLGHGASNLQIADELFVSENTVKTHLHNIFKKINAKNRLQALLWANNNIALEERA
ncbi:LuxR C-terminal-related transcriptional regulator [Vibrio sp. MarTm2]|uniref:LuxR family transcriptional regulator n=3 Tax=Vibrio TaxID=662 RepID=A0A0A5HVR0_PHOS4|nr:MULTISPECIES: LuxR C-terminal-related transcriptional regulator [Vibrio]EED28303.1 transcriptional regulator, LuxR family [Vibrio sp. 16]KGY09647.1 LuxR family transcriptional regulator [Vibrio sinaloensis]KHA62335.1 LuxR family transcriptional regulator [Vibrio variabilis]KHD26398.1 LuxR family transcriptional regulator [Vibrio caribbeanicus]KHT39336.1 LuxR family transcriptional regulator [Vibrio sinaloensis]